MFENIDHELRTGEKALWIYLRFKGGIVVPRSTIRIHAGQIEGRILRETEYKI